MKRNIILFLDIESLILQYMAQTLVIRYSTKCTTYAQKLTSSCSPAQSLFYYIEQDVTLKTQLAPFGYVLDW